MSKFYVDPINGADDNSGVDWDNAWKTGTLGATAARIKPGDEIRFAKSPDPTSLGNATWTKDSDEIELATSPVKNIVNGGETWTASTNITVGSGGTIRKVGTNGSAFIVGSSFTTGLMAYYGLGSTEDFSGYEQISFQIYTNSAIAASTLSVRLCSDVAGVTTVDTIAIPAIPETNKFHTFTVDTGAALGSSIQSIALYADIDPGSPSITVGQVMACKAKSSADSLNLNSLISKESDAKSIRWYPIRGIIGNTIYLDYKNTSSNATTGKFTGTTETVTTYKRETFKTELKTSSSYSDLTINDTGASFNPIIYSGGWNTSTDEKDGLTVFDGQNGEGSGFSLSVKKFIEINNFGFVRYDRNTISSCNDLTISNCFIVNNYDEVMYLTSSHYISICNLFVFGCQDLFISSSLVKFKNLFEESIGATMYKTGSSIFIQNHQWVEDNHWQYHILGSINTNDTIRHTASGISWEMIPTATSSEDDPLKFKLPAIPFKKATEVTVSVYVKKEHATNVGAKLVIEGGDLQGVSSDVTATKANDTAWERLSITFTPTEKTAANLYVYGWGNGTDSIYIDDLSKV